MKVVIRDRKGEIVTPPKQTPKQRAIWLTTRFNSKEDALEHVDGIIEIFADQLPPLTSDYWRDVRKEVEALEEW